MHTHHACCVWQVIVVGASNRPWAIDKAILRRMPRPFLIDIPDCAQRKDILRTVLRDETVDALDFDALAAATAGYSGSDLKELCRAALLAPVQDLIRDEEASLGAAAASDTAALLRPLRMTDILDAKKLVGPTGSLSPSVCPCALLSFFLFLSQSVPNVRAWTDAWARVQGVAACKDWADAGIEHMHACMHDIQAHTCMHDIHTYPCVHAA